MTSSTSNELREIIESRLLPELQIESVDPNEPIIAAHVPKPWLLLASGNYAAVFTHPDFPEEVVKVYAHGRHGFEDELEVYRRLGEHPAYSKVYFSGNGYLVLRRLHGITLYDAVHKGLPIPEQVIQDIDDALDYARSRGLHPHDVHGRNVMMKDGHGQVVDVSDFLEGEEDSKWQDLKLAYYRFYRPIVMRLGLPIPYFVLDFVRAGYRSLRKYLSRT